MSNKSTYAGVRWTKAELVDELEALLASNRYALAGSRRRELRDTYARRESILLSVLGLVEKTHDAAVRGEKENGT